MEDRSRVRTNGDKWFTANMVSTPSLVGRRFLVMVPAFQDQCIELIDGRFHFGSKIDGGIEQGQVSNNWNGFWQVGANGFYL